GAVDPTCAKLELALNNTTVAITEIELRIDTSCVPRPLSLRGLDCSFFRLHLAAVGERNRGLEDHLVAYVDAVAYLDLRSEIACHGHLVQVRGAIVRNGHLHAAAVEHKGVGRHHDRGSL